MPTLSWIAETATDRDAEARHVLRPPPATVAHFACTACGALFGTSAALAAHVSRKHPLELPSLYLHGRPLLRESVIRTPVREADISLVQSTYCRVRTNGGAWEKCFAAEFCRSFAQCSDATWDVELVHERATDASRADAHYHIRFRIPDPQKLDALDQFFAETLLREGVQHSDLLKFQTGLPAEAAAREYGAALGNYVLGILLKERQVRMASNLGLPEFAAKMREALDVLHLFNRPLALAVCSSIRFNLNEFGPSDAGTAIEVESGFRFFSGLSGNSMNDASDGVTPPRVEPASHFPICPVDRVSHAILELCSRLLAGEGYCSELETLLIDANDSPISEQDMLKIHVLCAEGYLRAGRLADAVPHLRMVRHSAPFREWATRYLTSS